MVNDEGPTNNAVWQSTRYVLSEHVISYPSLCPITLQEVIDTDSLTDPPSSIMS